MCGLVGFINNQNSYGNPHAIISKMTERLTHRGPDDGGVWCNLEDGIALGHRRLAILDLSAHGHQPMHSHNDQYVIVYNGEIYNYLELKKQLEKKNCFFSGNSDTEVILTLVTEYGLEATLQMISGMFAFALWDKKHKILHLARDRLGEKPLYYGLVNHSLVFASELKAIRAYPDFQNNLDRTSLAAFMQYGYVPAPQSIYEHIYKLEPGTYLSLSNAKISNLPLSQSYWSASHIAQQGHNNPLQLTDSEAIQETEKLLSSIVKSRMISDVPIGAFLSGGIDSSLITALMQKNSSQAIKTFTIGFPDQDYNEAVHAHAIANYLKTDHTELFVDAHQALDVIPKLPIIYDEPFADSSAIPTFLISQLTRQHVTVCLSGDGGDELFGGYNRYLLGKTLGNTINFVPYPLRLVLQKLLLAVSSPSMETWLRYTKIPMLSNKLHKLSGVIAAKSTAEVYQHLISQWLNPQEIVKEISSAINQPFLEALGKANVIKKMMLNDTIFYLPDDIMVKVDRAGMAVSLENRAPFLDHQLYEWAWQLPHHLKIRNRTTKWLLREVLARHIPRSLFERPKMGFSIPLDAWLREPLRDWASSLLDKQTMQAQGFLDYAPILKKWDEHVSGKRNWQYPLWTVLMFQAWLAHEKENIIHHQ